MQLRGASRTEIKDIEKLVQKFDYAAADAWLDELASDPNTDMIRFNMKLNLCRDAEARRVVADLLLKERQLDEFECVILRNAGHLCDSHNARALLNRAYTEFRGAMGKATTLNNLGVLELWQGNYDIARKHLVNARNRLEKQRSFEVYQPLTNLAALKFMQGDVKLSRQLLHEAKAATTREQLPMDTLMFRFNDLVINLAAKDIRLDEAAAEAAALYQRSLEETKDMRFQDSIAWFSGQLESLLGKTPRRWHLGYEARIRFGKCCGVEVFSKMRLERRNVTLPLQLSPHWRYTLDHSIAA